MTPEELRLCLRAAEAGYFDEVWLAGVDTRTSFRAALAARAGALIGRLDEEVRHWFENALGPPVYSRGGYDLWCAIGVSAGPWRI